MSNNSQFISFLLFVCYFLSQTSSFCSAESRNHLSAFAAKNLERLPDSVKAEFYDVRMFINITKIEDRPALVSNGTVTILLKVSKQTQTFYLSADEQLIIHSVYFSPDSTLEVTSFEVLSRDSMVKFNLNKMMEVGSFHNVTLEFTPSKRRASSLQGLYLVSELGPKGNFYANTHLEPIYARHVLPCFDEPLFKARFKVSIIHQDSYDSLSNMPLEKRTPLDTKPGYVQSEFEVTPKMSPYLLALVVHNLSKIETTFRSIDGRMVPLKFYTEDILMLNAEVAMNMSVKIFQMYEAWFKIPYPMPKVDLFTTRIPALAMENWGIISMSINLFIPKFHNPAQLSMILAHEIAHQWFGNLVTPSWWTDLWLKEGFATYLSLLAARNISSDKFSSVHLLEILSISKRDIMDADSLSSSLPVSRQIRTDADIVANFDRMSYGKSCLLISMIRETMIEGLDIGGEVVTQGLHKDPFIKGSSDYVKKFAFSTASNLELWESFTNVGNIFSCAPLQEIMKTWTEEWGYPVVGFDVNYETGQIVITQKRFVSDFSQSHSHKKVVWTFQLLLLSSNGLKRAIWVSQSQQIVTIDPELIGDWIMVSTPARSYYRVNYDYATWRRLIYAMSKKSSVFSSLQKSDLFDDSWALAFAGELPLEAPLILTSRAVVNETDDIFWNTVLDVLKSRVKVYSNSSIQQAFASYCLEALAKFPSTAARNPMQPNKDVVKLRYEQLLGELRDPKFIVTLHQRFNRYLDAGLHMSNLSQWLTLCYAVKEFGYNDTIFQLVSDKERIDKFKLSMAFYTTNYTQFLDVFKIANEPPYNELPLLWHPKRLTDCGLYTGSEFIWNHVMDNWRTIWNNITADQVKQLLIEIHFSTVVTREKLSQMDSFEKSNLDTLGVAKNSFLEVKQRAIRYVYWSESRFADKIGRWITRTINTTYLI